MCAFAILQYLPKSLEDHNYHLTDAVCKLTSRKNNGGLVFASNGVYEIVKRCERLFTINVLNSHSKITSEQGICKKLIILCVLELSARAECLFPNLKSSCLVPEDPASTDSYAVQIIKEVAKRYFTMRLQTYETFFDRVVVNKSKTSVHQKMTKLILFKNQ